MYVAKWFPLFTTALRNKRNRDDYVPVDAKERRTRSSKRLTPTTVPVDADEGATSSSSSSSPQQIGGMVTPTNTQQRKRKTAAEKSKEEEELLSKQRAIAHGSLRA
jgi:hypothetical protein